MHAAAAQPPDLQSGHEAQQGTHRPGQLLPLFEQHHRRHGRRREERDREDIIAHYVRKTLPDIMPVLAVTQGAHLGKKAAIFDRRRIRKEDPQVYSNGDREAQQVQQAQARVAPWPPALPEQKESHEEHGPAHEGTDRMHQHGTA